MSHQLRFRADYVLDLQVRGKPRLEKIGIRSGDVVDAVVQPYVEETPSGPVETANLHLSSNEVLLGVPMEYFSFE